MTTFEVREASTFTITGVLQDESGNGIGIGTVSELKATLWDSHSSAVINSRNHQSILNTNGGTLDGAGNFALSLTPADNAISSTTRTTERHLLLIEWTYAGTKAGKAEIALMVRNIEKVPT